jgi:hypothetical protein
MSDIELNTTLQKLFPLSHCAKSAFIVYKERFEDIYSTLDRNKAINIDRNTIS